MDIQEKIKRLAFCYLHGIFFMLALAALIKGSTAGFIIAYLIQTALLYYLVQKD